MDLTGILILAALTVVLFYACLINAGADAPTAATAHGHGHDAHGGDLEAHAHGHGEAHPADEHQGAPGDISHPREH